MKESPRAKTSKKPAKADTPVELAIAACLSIRFAVAQAERHGGSYNLLDILAAHRLATDALKKFGRLRSTNHEQAS
jgi:hypothetical protein